MVSFQCHTCGDVVKKPKLDQHRSRCHGGFDCIDCSTTFNTPAEYKGHTSCISEAEKYQKSLFKGPKKGNGQSNNNQTQALPQHKNEAIEAPASRQSNAQWNRTSQTTSLNNVNGYPGPQHIQGRQSQPQWQNGRNNNNYDRYTNGRRPPRPSATGANDTPLGTPRRTSPAGFGSSRESASTRTEKRQYLIGVDRIGDKMGKEDTKRKPEDLKIRENLVDVFPSAIEEKPGAKDKKKRRPKEESEMVVASNKDEDRPEMERHKKKRKEKEEKRKGKDPEFRTEDTETAAPLKKEKKRNDKKLNGETETNEETVMTIGGIETVEPGKKEKRGKKKEVNGTIDSTGGEVEMATGVDTNRKKEKRQREKATDVSKPDLERAEDERKAHKKRKLQADEVESKKKRRKEEKTKAVEAT